jgi:hypothetical protein
MGMREALEGLDSVEVWVDDLLHHSGTFEHFIKGLVKVFIRLLEKNIYLSAEKSHLCSDSVTWCGKIISKEEISFDDTYIRGLVDMASPRTAQELQQFCCGVNWLCLSLPDIAEHMDPLQEYLNTFGSSKSCVLRNVKLDCNEDLEKVFINVKEILKKAVRLTHPDLERESHEICLFTDASDNFWSVMLTQVPKGDLKSLWTSNGTTLCASYQGILRLPNQSGVLQKRKLFLLSMP